MAVILLISIVGTSQSQPLVDKLTDYVYSHHREKIYVSHDRNVYAPGETIWCKIFMVNGMTHEVFEAQPIVYADWIGPDDAIIKSYMVKITNGSATINIDTRPADKHGVYKLRAYSQYQRNFDRVFLFQKEIVLVQKKTELEELNQARESSSDITFYPEGGHLVNGISTRVAFQFANPDGTIEAIITDDTGQEITRARSLHEGRGYFELTPENGREYFFRYEDNGSEYKSVLHKALTTGLALRVSSPKKNTLVIQVSAQPVELLTNSRIIGHLRGQVFLDKHIANLEDGQVVFKTSSLPSGVLHFTLFDADENPVAERLIFHINSQTAAQVGLNFDAPSYRPRSKVTGEIQVSAGETNRNGPMSVTVYKSLNPAEDSLGLNIRNYLLLQSDLDRPIRQINQYFVENTTKNRVLLDLVAMTCGWRKFNWLDIKNNRRPDLIYPPEENFNISGRVTTRNGKKSIKADVSLNILDEGEYSMLHLTTDDNGLFSFRGFDFADTTGILIQAQKYDAKKDKKLRRGETKRTGKKNVALQLIRLEDMAVDPSGTLPADMSYKMEDMIQFEKGNELTRKIDSAYNEDWQIQLDPLTIRATRKTDREIKEDRLRDRYNNMGAIYHEDSQKIFFDDLPGQGAIYTNVLQIIRNRVPGAEVFTNGRNGGSVILRGRTSINLSSEAAFMVDGVFTDAQFALSLNPANILALDVVNGLYASGIYGGQGANGVIAITTRTADDRIIDNEIPIQGTINFQHPGYYQARTFASPDYSINLSSHRKPDYRNTLFWNGDAYLENGSAPFSFYTGDEMGSFLVKVEGVTMNGTPFVKYATIEVTEN